MPDTPDAGNPLLQPIDPAIIASALGAPSGTSFSPPQPSSSGSGNAPPTPAQSVGIGANKASSDFFAGIGATIGDAAAKIQAAFGAGKHVQQQAAAASQQQSQSIMQASQAEAAVAGNDAGMKAKEAADNAANAVRAGLSGPEFNKTLDAIRGNISDFRTFAAQKSQADNVSFFKDPGSFLVNQIITVPHLTTQMDDRVTALRGLTEGLSTASAAMQAGSQATAAIDSVNTVSRSADIQKQILATGKANAQEPLTKDAQINLSALNLAVSSAGEIIKAADVQAGIPLKEEQQAYFAANKDAIIANKNAQTILDNERANVIKQQQTDKQQMLNVINIGRASLAQPPINDLSVLPTSEQKTWLKVGVNTAAGGGPGYGPYDTVKTMDGLKINPATLPAGQLITVRDIQEQSSQFQQQAAMSKLSARPGENGERSERDNFIDQSTVRAYIQRQGYAFDPKTGATVVGKGMSDTKPDPLFGPQPLTSMLQQSWAAKNPVLQAMKPATMDGNGKPVDNVPTRYESVMKAAASLVASGKMTPDKAAASIKEIAVNSIADNDKAYGFRRYAIPYDNSSYLVSLPRPGAFFGGTNDVTDLFQPAQIMRYLNSLKTVGDSNLSNFGNK